MNKINVKDLINIGVFTALYLVLFFMASFLGYVPVLFPALPVICAAVVGIPFMLFLSRVHTFGMITIMSIILGLFVFLMGRPWPTILIAVGAGLVTDFLLKSKEYKSIKLAVIGSGIFSVWMMGMILPLFFGYRTGYLQSIRAGYGDAYVETISSITPDWMFFVLFALCILGGILGGLLGAKVLKKHFKKAGMA